MQRRGPTSMPARKTCTGSTKAPIPARPRPPCCCRSAAGMYFNESDERVNLKLKAAINHGLTPIVCIGETLTEREDMQTEEVLRRQLRAALLNVSATEAHRLVIAYEPVWAIGTGSTASPEMANEAHAIIRHELGLSCDGTIAENTRILYGGSVKPENISELMQQDQIDGALVGGA